MRRGDYGYVEAEAARKRGPQQFCRSYSHAEELEADVFTTWAAFDHSRQTAELQQSR